MLTFQSLVKPLLQRKLAADCMWLWHQHVDMGGRARCQWVVEIYAFISWGSNYNWDHHWHWPTADLEGKSKEYFNCAPGHPISITIFQSHGLIKIKFWSSSRMWTKCQPRWLMPIPVHKNRWYLSMTHTKNVSCVFLMSFKSYICTWRSSEVS